MRVTFLLTGAMLGCLTFVLVFSKDEEDDTSKGYAHLAKVEPLHRFGSVVVEHEESPGDVYLPKEEPLVSNSAQSTDSDETTQQDTDPTQQHQQQTNAPPPPGNQTLDKGTSLELCPELTRKPHVTMIQRALIEDNCKKASELKPKPSEKDLTVVITTYKGHATLTHTIKSWRDSEFLSLKRLKEIIVHVNKCTCEDIVLIDSLLGSVPHRVLCNPGNSVHPMVLLTTMMYTTTELVLLSENDRPILPRPYEDTTQLVTRVANFLNLSFGLLSNISTPYVFLERGVMLEDEKIYQQMLSQNVTKFNTTKLDWVKCGDTCMKWAFASSARRKSMYKKCKKMERPIVMVDRQHTGSARRPNKVKWVKQWGNCEWQVCKEWSAFVTGNKKGPSTCLTTLMRNQELGSIKSTMIATAGTPDMGGPIYCTQQRSWSNGPAIFRVDWYAKHVIGNLCDDPLKAGLLMKPSRPHFGYYGREMEYFLTARFASNSGIPHCRGDGLMDHIELESYDNNLVARR